MAPPPGAAIVVTRTSPVRHRDSCGGPFGGAWETPLVGPSVAVVGSGATVDVGFDVMGLLGAASADGWVDDVQPVNGSRIAASTAAVDTYLRMDIGFSLVNAESLATDAC
jgi:hypothetical protein